MNYAALRTCDVANGEGVRVTLFVSGCTHHCRECFNPDQWSFDYGKPFDAAAEEAVFTALQPSHITGLSILGGEPMEPSNQRALVPFLRRFRERFGETRNLWVWTGCVLERDLLSPTRWRTEVTDEFLSQIDVLVDGPIVLELKDISLKFRGSSNHRILNLHEQRRHG